MSSVVLCKTLKFFCRVWQTLGESTERRVFSGLKGDRSFKSFLSLGCVSYDYFRFLSKILSLRHLANQRCVRTRLFVAIDNLATDAPYHLLY
ncbi:hypothetical protein Q5688_28635 [Microcoleus sp. herbarium5]